jgi:hypothetical protein
MKAVTKSILVTNALLDLSVTVRQARRDYPQVKAGRVPHSNFNRLDTLLTMYSDLISTIDYSDCTKIEQAFAFVYVKGAKIMSDLHERALTQIDRSSFDVRHSNLSFWKLTDKATYSNVNDLLDDLLDFESDGGFELVEKHFDKIQYKIFKGLATSFASHVLHNKYLLAIGVHDDMLTMLENVIDDNSNNKNILKLRRFRKLNGDVTGRQSPPYAKSERLANPPADATKIVFKEYKPSEKVELKSSFDKKPSYKHRRNLKWYCPLVKKEEKTLVAFVVESAAYKTTIDAHDKTSGCEYDLYINGVLVKTVDTLPTEFSHGNADDVVFIRIVERERNVLRPLSPSQKVATCDMSKMKIVNNH